MATSLPAAIRRDFPGQAGMLGNWQAYGWLGGSSEGTGSRFPWDDSGTKQQISWLGRLRDSGRVLDDEDTSGGFRLRAHGFAWGLRIGTGQWWGYNDLALMLEESIVARCEACTIIRVNF